MLVCIDFNNYVVWAHEDITLKEQEPWKEDSNVIVSKIDSLPEIPQDDYTYAWLYDVENDVVELVQTGKNLPDPNELLKETLKLTKQASSDVLVTTDVAMSTLEATEVVAGDNLLNMDMLVGIDEKLNKILTHLGI